ncbi:MAG TPA: prolipoprotein diacylglyceryl transferase family protein [Armatimonadota bacterium]|nr:prolipoprotein diacylglyceryl transferase family protein [Armatimonadota bacterium]
MTVGSLLTLAGYGVGALVLYLAARRRGVATEGMAYVAVAGLCGGILGAKLTEWVLGHGALLAAHPGLLLDPRLGGRTLIGGVLVGWVSVEIAKRRLGIRRSTGDLFALALPAGEAVGRVGCYFNGCCFGVSANVAWAVRQHGEWRHPTQLYSALAAVVILGVLLSVRDRLPREGDLFRLYLVLFGLSRFGLEFLRERPVGLGGLSLAQWVCLELAVVVGVMLLLSRRRAGAPGVSEA